MGSPSTGSTPSATVGRGSALDRVVPRRQLFERLCLQDPELSAVSVRVEADRYSTAVVEIVIEGVVEEFDPPEVEAVVQQSSDGNNWTSKSDPLVMNKVGAYSLALTGPIEARFIRLACSLNPGAIVVITAVLHLSRS